ncbi:hypothetical protein [Bilophila wadsworthia]|uniref:hypothetical protein n=1 Tax=Bilophila wadsworthia TaxID=35833 RepID=UPI00243075BA|nr:hypothetical protein [Bilophila wadsworthia]
MKRTYHNHSYHSTHKKYINNIARLKIVNIMYINDKKEIKNFIQYLKKDILRIQQRINDIQSGRDDIDEHTICIYKEHKKLSYIKKQIKNRRQKTLKRLKAQRKDLLIKRSLLFREYLGCTTEQLLFSNLGSKLREAARKMRELS